MTHFLFHDPRNRRRPHHLTALVFVFVVVALIAAPLASADRRDPTLSKVASDIAGKPSLVTCSSTNDVGSNGFNAAGVVYVVGGKTMYLAKNVCDTLLDRSAAPDWALALVTIAHEAQHLKGISDESEADCNALKVAASVGIRFFHLTRKQLHAIMAKAWVDHRAKPPTYRTLC